MKTLPRKPSTTRCTWIDYVFLTPVLVFVILLGFFKAGVSFADDRPKIGLALAGGGARGAAHIGVLKRLEELRIPIDYIAGTSFGAVVGGLYASGMTPDELEEVINTIDWDSTFTDKPPRDQLTPRRKVEDNRYLVDKLPGIKDGKLKLPRGVIQGQALYALIKKLTRDASSVTDFDDFDPPFRAVATNLETGDEVVIDHGDLATAIRASMSVPAIFTPVELDGELLVDGGLSNNLPISVVREMGADIIIAVDISSPLADRDQLDNVLSVAYQLTNFLTRKNAEQQILTLTDDDILLVPELHEIDSANFEAAAQAVGIGYSSALANSTRLSGLGISEEDYAGYVLYRSEKIVPQPVVQYIDFVTGEDISTELLRKKVVQPLDQLLDTELMEQSIGYINGLGYFEAVYYDVTERDDMTGVTITARPRSWGPRYVQLGAEYSSNFTGSDAISVRLGYLVSPLGIDGSEFSTELSLGQDTGLWSEYFRPFSPASDYFYAVAAFGGEQQYDSFIDDEVVGQTDFSRLGGSARIGRFLGLDGEASLGIRLYSAEQKVNLGLLGNERSQVGGGELFARLTYDTLDDSGFPTRGNYLEFNALKSDQNLGAETDFGQYSINYFGVYSAAGLTFTGGVLLGLTTHGLAPIQNLYRFGGLFQLGGTIQDQVSDQNLLLLRSGISKRMDLLGMSDIWLGGMLQYATSKDDLNSELYEDGIYGTSIYLGKETFIGPIYFGYGYSEAGSNSVQIVLGTQF